MTERAFTPLRIGPVELPNRLALAPVKTALGGTDGRASAAHVAHCRRRGVEGPDRLEIHFRIRTVWILRRIAARIPG